MGAILADNGTGGGGVAMRIPAGGTGVIRVIGGVGERVSCTPISIARVSDPAVPSAVIADQNESLPVKTNPHLFTVRGLIPGRAIINVIGKPMPNMAFTNQIIVEVVGTLPGRRPDSDFVWGYTPHHHQPCRKSWSEINYRIPQPWSDKDGFLVGAATNYPVCRTARDVVNLTRWKEFADKPVALSHLDWYLTGGGKEYNEDKNLWECLHTDSQIRQLLRQNILLVGPRGSCTAGQFHFKLWDYRYAFGELDRLEWEVDHATKTVTVWFIDCYEFHPYWPGVYEVMKDDYARVTNTVNAALVEMKLEGARDFTMKGQATVPLDLIMTM